MWRSGVVDIKAESSALFLKKTVEGPSSEVRDLYEAWISRVKAFKDAFGENRTPQDIKWALNDAENSLGVSVTEWENPPDAAVFRG